MLLQMVMATPQVWRTEKDSRGPLGDGTEVDMVAIVVIVIIPLIGIIVAGAAGLLAWVDGKSVPAAILIGGSAFAGTATVGLLMVAAVVRS
jgi:hypothetical protein